MNARRRAVRRAFTVTLLAALPAAFTAPPVGASDAGSTNRVWRMGGHLRAADGHAYDFAVDFFGYPVGHGIAVLPADVTLVDETAQNVLTERRSERGIAPALDAAVRLAAGTWTLRERRSGSRARFVLDVRTHGTRLEVEAAARTGRIAYDFGRGPHVAFPALAARATLSNAGGRVALRGSAWFDRAAGLDAAPARGTKLGEFLVQLDDGRELIVERADAPDGTTQRALLVDAGGRATNLAPSAYAFGESSVRHSTRAAADYPSQFGLDVPGRTEQLLLEPVALDQESTTTGMGAWLAASAFDVFDNTPGSTGARLGSASGLLVGYDRPADAP